MKPGGGSNNITLTFNAIGSEVVEGADLSALFEMAHVIGSGRMDLCKLKHGSLCLRKMLVWNILRFE